MMTMMNLAIMLLIGTCGASAVDAAVGLQRSNEDALEARGSQRADRTAASEHRNSKEDASITGFFDDDGGFYYYYYYYAYDDTWSFYYYYYDDSYYGGVDDDYTTDDALTADIVDDFSAFRGDVWLFQCSGCRYESGSLYVSGDSKLQRTVGTFSALQHIKGSFVKSATCNDHIVMISTKSTLASEPWIWSSSADSAKFVFNCNEKYLYGQTTSDHSTCFMSRTYVIDIAVTKDSILYNDDECGTIKLADPIGADSVYIYLGAGASPPAPKFCARLPSPPCPELFPRVMLCCGVDKLKKLTSHPTPAILNNDR